MEFPQTKACINTYKRSPTSKKNILLDSGLGSRSRSEPGVFGSLEPESEPEPLEKKRGAGAGAAWKKNSGAGAGKN